MALTVVGVATAAQPSGTSIDIPVPAEAQPGDLLIAVQGDQSNTSDDNNGHPDFTRLTPWVPDDNDGRVIGIWGKVHDTGTSFTFTRHGAATRSVGAILALRGHATPYLDDAVASYAGTSISNGRRVESLDATVAGLQVLFARSEFTTGNTHVPSVAPAGFTEAANWQTGSGTTASRSGGWLGHRAITPGATGTADIVWASPSGPSAQSVIIREAADDPEPGAYTPFKWWNGTAYTDLNVSVWDGSGYTPIQEA